MGNTADSRSTRGPVRLWLGCWWLLLAPVLVLEGAIAGAQAVEPRNVLIEVFHRATDGNGAEAIAAIRELQSARGGITLVVRDLAKDPRDQDRLNEILKHFGITQKKLPIVYGCNRVLHDPAPPESWASQSRRMLQVEVFVRTGCPRCKSAKEWLPSFMKDYPGLELVYRDVAADRASATRMSNLVAKHKKAAASVPVFHLCDTLVIGFDARGTTEERLRSTLKHWTHVARKPGEGGASRPATRDSVGAGRGMTFARRPASGAWVAGSEGFDAPAADVEGPSLQEPQEPGESASLPVPGTDAGQEGEMDDAVDLPVFGRLAASKLGMPLFTIAMGLVDGFNPCAMWVLLFLLSILVNLGSRARILAIAGTFVVISGLAYFAFMAAWLNIFLLIGYLRPIQVGLAVVAILIGAIHVKDSIAFKRGISLSIPESAKPRIYARVRRIVTAEHLTGAVLGAITLAVLVNVIELLCTSGLPALYTSILTQQEYSAAGRYAYLGLYIAAYMLDDALMVGIVVLTLDKMKLQESRGRWLKLVSGAAILLLGVVMLVRPEWLA